MALMMDQTYSVLYTHQKNKKAKTWHDGVLKVVSTGTKATLYDEKGARLDALHVHVSDVRPGEQLESDKYYIQVEEVSACTASQPQPTTVKGAACDSALGLRSSSQQEIDISTKSSPCGGAASGQVVAGLKRKRNGFIPPRLVRPHPSAEPLGITARTGPLQQLPHCKQATPCPWAQKLPRWSSEETAGQTFSSAPVMNGAPGVRSESEQFAWSLPGPNQHGSSVTGSPTTGRKATLGNEASAHVSPDVSSSHLAALQRNSPWRVFGSSSGRLASCSPSRQKEASVHPEGLDVDVSDKQLSPQAQLSQFCSAGDISDNVCTLSNPRVSSNSDAFAMSSGTEPFSNKHCDDRGQAEDRVSFPACKAKHLKPDKPPVKRSAAEIMALLQGRTSKETVSEVNESCTADRSKARFLSQSRPQPHQKEQMDSSSSGRQTKCFSSSPVSVSLINPFSALESSVFQLHGSPAVGCTSSCLQNSSCDSECANAGSRHHREGTNGEDLVSESSMLGKMLGSQNIVAEENCRIWSPRNVDSNFKGQSSPVNSFISSMSSHDFEQSGNLMLSDAMLEDQSDEDENVIQCDDVVENTECKVNVKCNVGVLENVAESGENFTQNNDISGNTITCENKLVPNNGVLKNRVNEPCDSQNVAMTSADSISCLELLNHESCNIFSHTGVRSDGRDPAVHRLGQDSKESEHLNSSQEWQSHHSKLHQSSHSECNIKSVCELSPASSVASWGRGSQSEINNIGCSNCSHAKHNSVNIQNKPDSNSLQNKLESSSSPRKHNHIGTQNILNHSGSQSRLGNFQVETSVTSMQDDSEFLDGCFDLTFSPLSQELSNSSSMEAADTEPTIALQEEAKNLGPSLKNTANLMLSADGRSRGKVEETAQTVDKLKKSELLMNLRTNDANTVYSENTWSDKDVLDRFSEVLADIRPKKEGESLSEISHASDIVDLSAINGMLAHETVAKEENMQDTGQTSAAWKTLADVEISPEGDFPNRSSQYENSEIIDKFRDPAVNDTERLGDPKSQIEAELREPCEAVAMKVGTVVEKDMVKMQDDSSACGVINMDHDSGWLSPESNSSKTDVAESCLSSVHQLSLLSGPSVSSPGSVTASLVLGNCDAAVESTVRNIDTNIFQPLELKEMTGLCSQSHGKKVSQRRNTSNNGKSASDNYSSRYHGTVVDNYSYCSFQNSYPLQQPVVLDDSVMLGNSQSDNFSDCREVYRPALEVSLPKKTLTGYTMTVSEVLDSELPYLGPRAASGGNSVQPALCQKHEPRENFEESPLKFQQRDFVADGWKDPFQSSGSSDTLDGMVDVQEPGNQTIAEVVSAKLTCYKMQGMVSSDLVHRHLSPRPHVTTHYFAPSPACDAWMQKDVAQSPSYDGIDPDNSKIWPGPDLKCDEGREMKHFSSANETLPGSFHTWLQQSTSKGLRENEEIDSKKETGFWHQESADNGLVVGSLHESQGPVWASVGASVDIRVKNVRSALPQVRSCSEQKSLKLSSPWTPEARLQYLSGGGSEDQDRSFYLDCNSGKPHLATSPHFLLQPVALNWNNKEMKPQEVPDTEGVKHTLEALQKAQRCTPAFASASDDCNYIAEESLSFANPQCLSTFGRNAQLFSTELPAETVDLQVLEIPGKTFDDSYCLDATKMNVNEVTSSHLLSPCSASKDFGQVQGLQRRWHSKPNILPVNDNRARNMLSGMHLCATENASSGLNEERNSLAPMPSQPFCGIEKMCGDKSTAETSNRMLRETGSTESSKRDGVCARDGICGKIRLEEEVLQDFDESFSDLDFGILDAAGEVETDVRSSAQLYGSSSVMQRKRKIEADIEQNAATSFSPWLFRNDNQKQNEFCPPQLSITNDALENNSSSDLETACHEGKAFSKAEIFLHGIEEPGKSQQRNLAQDVGTIRDPEQVSLGLKAKKLLQSFQQSQWSSCGQDKKQQVYCPTPGYVENVSGNSEKSSTSACGLVPEMGIMLLPSTQPDSPPLDLSPDVSNNPPDVSKTDPLPLAANRSLTLLHGIHGLGDQTCTRGQPEHGTRFSQSKTLKRLHAELETSRKVGLAKFKKPNPAHGSCLSGPQVLCQELLFPSKEEVENQATPLRQVTIPTSFDSVISYKNTLVAAVTEHMNIQLFELAKSYHAAMASIDLSAFTEGAAKGPGVKTGSTNPVCKCSTPSKVVQVKKEGPNKGRLFYACPGPRDKQCKFFQWLDQARPDDTTGLQHHGSQPATASNASRTKLGDGDSIMTYFQGQGLSLYCQCLYVTHAEDRFNKRGICPRVRHRQWEEGVPKKNIYIKLPKKVASTIHAKDDLWVISRSLSFEGQETFIARSTFHGPNANGEVAIDPVSRFFPSVWNNECACHALHTGNAATELSCIANLQEYVNLSTLPILPHLLSNVCSHRKNGGHGDRTARGSFKSPQSLEASSKLHLSAQYVKELADEFIAKYMLNSDQGMALQKVADMMNKDSVLPQSVLLVHGVFGAGKSFLLSVVIVFLVELFQRNESYAPGVPFPWKLLLSSTTNVAVDRVLQGLLGLGFEDFVRVGSIKKIAKPLLPYSVHATGTDSQELKDLREMLESNSTTPAEKHFVRKSIERHRLGENRKRLGAVRVVGVTCAASSFQCLDKMQFPFVVLDECSQMTEPASLLPVARFGCEKLVLVGDPKQLDPTLQGSEPAHAESLEQTLFDRLMKMGCEPVMLRTQYRCHPVISAVASALFYQHQLIDGITGSDRKPLLNMLPTMCFYDASTGQERSDSGGSFFNNAEAQFVVLLLRVLLSQEVASSSVGVITLYKAQARRIMDIIKSTESDRQKELSGVQVSTVDAFQGAERNIIILSCVRTHSLGFIDSDKRMNVALTRARHHLLIVGSQRNLRSNARWASVLKHCQGVQNGIVAASQAIKTLEAMLDDCTGSHLTRENVGMSSSASQSLCTARTRASVLTQPAHLCDKQELEAVEDASLTGCSQQPLETAPIWITSSSLALSSQSASGIEGAEFTSASHDASKARTGSAGVGQSWHHLAVPLVIKEDTTSDNDELPDGL